MMTREKDKNREQVMFFSMEDMVPKDHILRLIDESISFDFIYGLVRQPILIRENFHFCNETQHSTVTVGARIVATVYNKSEMEELDNVEFGRGKKDPENRKAGSGY